MLEENCDVYCQPVEQKLWITFLSNLKVNERMNLGEVLSFSQLKQPIFKAFALYKTIKF